MEIVTINLKMQKQQNYFLTFQKICTKILFHIDLNRSKIIVSSDYHSHKIFPF